MKEQSAILKYVVGIYTLHAIFGYAVLNCVLQTLNFHLSRVDYFGIFIYAHLNSGTNRSHSKRSGIILTTNTLIIG